MASRAFLGMKPKVTTTGLAQTDPVVLAMVSPHLEQQTPRRNQFQWLRRALPLLASLLLAASWIEQFLQFDA